VSDGGARSPFVRPCRPARNFDPNTASPAMPLGEGRSGRDDLFAPRFLIRKRSRSGAVWRRADSPPAFKRCSGPSDGSPDAGLARSARSCVMTVLCREAVWRRPRRVPTAREGSGDPRAGVPNVVFVGRWGSRHPALDGHRSADRSSEPGLAAQRRRHTYRADYVRFVASSRRGRFTSFHRSGRALHTPWPHRP
jgi:hypothetical protein